MPANFAFGERVRPISVIAVTDLPEPDSPTIASISPGLRSKLTPSTAWTTPVLGRERDLEVLHPEERLVLRLRGLSGCLGVLTAV